MHAKQSYLEGQTARSESRPLPTCYRREVELRGRRERRARTVEHEKAVLSTFCLFSTRGFSPGVSNIFQKLSSASCFQCVFFRMFFHLCCKFFRSHVLSKSLIGKRARFHFGNNILNPRICHYYEYVFVFFGHELHPDTFTLFETEYPYATTPITNKRIASQ